MKGSSLRLTFLLCGQTKDLYSSHNAVLCLITRNMLIITDLGEEAIYTDNQARFSYRFEISTIILLMQKAYNINKLNKKL